MRKLERLTPERLAIAEARLRNPAAGSRIAAARDSGVDMTLLIEKLRLTPAERVEQMMAACGAAAQVRGAARQ